MLKKRDSSIELMKAIAALIVLNSHMDEMYGDYSYLATGGAIGDALFFFCSGYTLFLARGGDFFNWYKRRIRRIYPTVLVISLIGAGYTITPIKYTVDANIGSGWFVICILVYYIFLYPIRMYMNNHLKLMMFLSSCIIIIWYYTLGLGGNSAHSIYGANYFKWCFFFVYMLLGAICGKSFISKKQIKDNGGYTVPFWVNCICVIVNVVLFYIVCFFTQSPEKEVYQLLSLLPLGGVCFFLWRLCNSRLVEALINNRYWGGFILAVGGLCLEIYLVQGLIFTNSLNHIFPLNIPIIMMEVVLGAYILRCFSRVLLQTFEKENYNIREIFKLIN